MLSSILVEGLIYAIMVLGVFITFRILDFPDLTVDGSFATGACVAGILILNGYDMNSVLIVAFIAGVGAGVFTALLHTVLKIPNLLAGIITMTMLYSINIRILLNKSYLSLTDYKNEGSMIVYSASAAILKFLSSIGISVADKEYSTDEVSDLYFAVMDKLGDNLGDEIKSPDAFSRSCSEILSELSKITNG